MAKFISNFKKKQKLNQFMKISDRNVYYRMFHSIVLRESYNYIDIEDDIKKLVYFSFYGASCEIHYLGSRVIGLGYEKESDLDLFIDIGNRYYEDRAYEMDVDQIEIFRDIFIGMSNEWTFRKINYSVPSIKAIHKRTGILCDISITNGLAVHNSHLLGHLFKLQPEAVALFHYLKKWLKLFDVRFKGFTLTLLVVFFLQKQKLLPTIKRVQRDVYPEIYIDGYAVQFDETRNRDYYGLEKIEYYKDYVKKFFIFYAHFDFDCIISTYSGCAIRKNEYSESIDSKAALTIAAPLLRRTNCSKYISDLQLAEFIDACRFSMEYLDEYRVPESLYNDFEFFDEDTTWARFHNDYDF